MPQRYEPCFSFTSWSSRETVLFFIRTNNSNLTRVLHTQYQITAMPGGAVVIDNSSAFRYNDEVPLVVSVSNLENGDVSICGWPEL